MAELSLHRHQEVAVACNQDDSSNIQEHGSTFPVAVESVRQHRGALFGAGVAFLTSLLLLLVTEEHHATVEIALVGLLVNAPWRKDGSSRVRYRVVAAAAAAHTLNGVAPQLQEQGMVLVEGRWWYQHHQLQPLAVLDMKRGLSCCGLDDHDVLGPGHAGVKCWTYLMRRLWSLIDGLVLLSCPRVFHQTYRVLPEKARGKGDHS